MATIGHQPATAEASSFHQPSTSSHTPRRLRTTRYPQWPKHDEEAEYHEIPPEHFLAHAGSSKSQFSLTSNGNDAATASSSLSVDVFDPWAAETQNLGAGAFEEMPDTSTLAAADFDVDVRTGFLPPEPPLERLTDEPYVLWEDVLANATQSHLTLGGEGPQEESARRWRSFVRKMPTLPVNNILRNDIRRARRAHLVLSFIAHFYLHSQGPAREAPLAPVKSWRDTIFGTVTSPLTFEEQSAAEEADGTHLDKIPASISTPWIQLSQMLGLPPILTYATTVLWNWTLIEPALGITPQNVKMVQTFTGSESENHFYLTSLLIEMHGVEALSLMRRSLDEIFIGDNLAARRCTTNLFRLAKVIRGLTQVLAKVRDGCDPGDFYWKIRPWFRGADASHNGRGWHYEGIDSIGTRRHLGGPSAGQSSLIHAIDVFLDVDHTRAKTRLRERQTRPDTLPPSDATFMERMSFYMPKHHRNFLRHLRSLSFEDFDTPSNVVPDSDGKQPSDHPVRAFVLSRLDTDEELVQAYDAALMALKALRDEHMRIAAQYIISQARKSPVKQQAVHSDAASQKEPEFRGTGGTDLVLFLRDCRANTLDATVGEQ